MFLPVGTVINTITLLLGASLGLIFHKNIPHNMKTIVFQGMGLVTLILGIQMALKTTNPLVLIFSIVIGGIIGELFNIQGWFEKLGNILKSKVKSKDERFTEGLLTTFILFCIGPMTILGTINEGLRGDRTLLITKSILDGFTSIAFASTYGVGVLFAAIPLFIFQTALTLMATFSQVLFTQSLVTELSSVGGVLLMAIAVNMLELKKIKTSNLLPSLLVVIFLSLLLESFL